MVPVRFLPAAIAAALCANVLAGNFHVAPVRVEIAPDARSGMLTVRNEAADEAVVIQASTLAWRQRDGRDITEPTSELLVNPPVFTIKPGGQQIVRVGLRNPAQTSDARNELSYRLLLAEVPQAAPADFRGIRVALNMTIPVFVAPAASGASAIPELTVQRTGDGQLAATIHNRDSKRFHITEIALLAQGGENTLSTSKEARYVLPGSIVAWRMSGIDNLPSRYTVRLRSDRGSYAYDVVEGEGAPRIQARPPQPDSGRSP